MKYLLIVFVLFSLSGCGVSTDSSKNLQGSGTNTGTGTGTGGTTTPTDTNGSGNSGSTNGSTNIPMFDTSGGAIYDPNACKSAYATAVPLQDSADTNSQRETSDNANGISIMSLYPQTFVPADSNIIAFYKTLPSGTVLTDVTQRKNVYGDNSQFIIMYDVAWITTPNNTIYVQTPKLAKQLDSCFRIAIVDSNNSIPIVPQKVYSYKQ